MTFITIPLVVDNDAGDAQIINDIVTNLNHLNDTKIQVSYNAYGVLRDEGMKIATGVVDANNPNGSNRIRWIETQDFFTPTTRPIALATFAAEASIPERRSTITIAHRTGQGSIIDHTGFQAYVRTLDDSAKLTGPNYINWIMIGY